MQIYPPDHQRSECADLTGSRGNRSRFVRLFTGWRRSDSGTSAVEFAFIAPMLFFGLLSMVDLGLAINERMTIDHVLRAGAQRAIADPGAADVLNVVNTTAAKSFSSSKTPLSVTVQRFCACPESTGTAVACSTSCQGPKPTFIYYRLSGLKTYKGMLLPAITAKPAVQVQIR